ncbi:MAG: HlyD family type I secretion periplasmic adaptor subunit [Rhodospirillales bacterium]|nr:HlyD family type I secretion periplasmic adaptor subunit [Rhodospirillales bacterium]
MMTEPIAAKQHPTPLGTHLFLGCCVLLVVVFLVWASIGKLDVVSMAMGEVVPSSQVKSVQHLEGGIVSSILVREGDRVSKDQPLVELEPTRSGAEVEELDIRLTALRVNILRLEAEANDFAELVIPAELRQKEPDQVRQARALFKVRQNRVRNQIRAQRQEIIQREQEIKEVQARIRTNSSGLQLIREQLKISSKLIKLDLSNRMNHLNLQKEESDYQGRLDEDRIALPRTKAAFNAAKAQLAAIESGFREEATLELTDARRTYRELSQRVRTANDNLRRTILRAPVDGIIKTLYVVTVGGVVQAGKTVVDIVPGDDRLVIEARLPTTDIGYIEVGQPARIQLASAEAVRFGTLEGTVIQISPDTIVTQDGAPYYKVRIQTVRDYFERGNLRYRLSPGMQVQSSIQTGTRTVARYLLDPYIGKMSFAFTER